MLPSPSPKLPTFDPVAARAQFQQRQIAARRAKNGTDTAGRVRPSVGSSRRVQTAEAQLPDEQRAAAEELRRHKTYEHQRSTPPLILPEMPIVTEGEEDEGANAEMQRYSTYEQAALAESRYAQSMDLVNGARARMAAAHHARAEAERRAITEQNSSPIVDTNKISSYALSFLSFIGMPGVDAGASYTTGSSGTIYKVVMSLAKSAGFSFAEEIEKVPFAPKVSKPLENPAAFASYLFILFWGPMLLALLCLVVYYLIGGRL